MRQETTFGHLPLEVRSELINHAIEGIKDRGEGTLGCDLHNLLFNEDYYLIGRYEAEQWLNKVGIFNAINVIKEYEEMNFGEVTTDLSEPERVCNMFVYIVGEELLGELDTLRDLWDNELSEDNVNSIIDELERL
jgi:hypothetical protein